MKALLSTALLLAVSMNSAIAADDAKLLKVTAWDDGKVSQNLEFPIDSTFAAHCVDATKKSKIMIEKGDVFTASCPNSKTSVFFEPTKKTVVADKVEILRAKNMTADVVVVPK